MANPRAHTASAPVAGRVALIAGFALVTLIAVTISVAAIELIAGAALSPLTAPLGALIACAGTIALFRREPPRTVAAGLALALGVIMASILLSGRFLDISYDGNSYQKAAIGALAHGWNPLREGIDAYYARAATRLSPITHALWIEHYPKASWLYGAAVYQLTGSIETAKSINLAMMVALALLAWHSMRERGVRRPVAGAVAFLLAVNPIAFPQLATAYVDGLLASTLLSIIVLLIELSCTQRNRRLDAVRWWMLAAALVICVNIKFTGFVYAGFFCGSFYLLWIIRSARTSGARAAGRVFSRLTIYYVAVVAFAACLVGANPYLTNAKDHGSPFYPLISAQTVDIINAYQPDDFQSMNPYEKFALVTLSRTENATKAPVQLKLPFTAQPDELAINGYDTRRAGFGAWSSGIFLISLAVCGIASIRAVRDRWRDAGVAAALAVPTIALIGMTDGSWWARYTPYLWLMPSFALLMLLDGAGRQHEGLDTRGRRIGIAAAHVMGIALGVLMVANLATFAPSLTSSLDASRAAEAFFEQLRAARDEGRAIEVTLADPAKGGALYDLIDTGIDYRYVNHLSDGDAYNLSVVGLSAQPVDASAS